MINIGCQKTDPLISNNTDAVVIKKDEVIHIYCVNSIVKSFNVCASACILLLL